MTLALDKLGALYDERVAAIDPDRARAYAAATNDDLAAYRAGEYAPPVFGVVPVWDGMLAVVADVVPPQALVMAVHGEQDMHFHRPLVPGRSLATRAEPFSVRVGPSGTRFTVRLTSNDAEDGGAVLEQYVTMFIRGLSEGESAGPDRPDHTFPEEARGRKVGDYSVHVDDDQTFRYRDASGDQMPIHVDEQFAKSVGLPGIIAHGLCTMAMTSQAVLRLVADGDPARLRRLAVRFSKNVFPGSDVVTSVYDAGKAGDRHVYAYEAHSRADLVIANGRAEIGPVGA
ncbi:MAG TPA: MaoC/PaaZ C-terminal domain-containing protein [Acidimicrobiales bacterium]|nr:MaoC/PaaZ C-terminal domain-containing protein [Acidimicrobiales bacterium]